MDRALHKEHLESNVYAHKRSVSLRRPQGARAGVGMLEWGGLQSVRGLPCLLVGGDGGGLACLLRTLVGGQRAGWSRGSAVSIASELGSGFLRGNPPA